MVHTWNPITQETEVGGLQQVQGRPDLHHEFWHCQKHNETCLKHRQCGCMRAMSLEWDGEVLGTFTPSLGVTKTSALQTKGCRAGAIWRIPSSAEDIRDAQAENKAVYLDQLFDPVHGLKRVRTECSSVCNQYIVFYSVLIITLIKLLTTTRMCLITTLWQPHYIIGAWLK